MIEYSRENRFPFHVGRQVVSVVRDDPDGLCELDIVLGEIVSRFPRLEPEVFYGKVFEVERTSDEALRLRLMKSACDQLLRDIMECLADEQFIHRLHDRNGYGVDKVI